MCELLPKIGAAWRDGEITGGAARTIAAARVEGHDLKLRALEDTFLLPRPTPTTSGSCGGRARTSGAVHGPTGPSRAAHDGRHDLPHLRRATTLLNGELSSSGAEIVATALHALTDPPSDDDARTPARRRADALVRMAELALANLAGAGRSGAGQARRVRS